MATPTRPSLTVGQVSESSSTILVGAVGAVLGGLMADALGVGDTGGIDWIKHGIQVIVAMVVTVIYVNRSKRRQQVAIPER